MSAPEVRDFVQEQGAADRRHRAALDLLRAGATLDEIVVKTALPRRAVERILTLAGDDIELDAEARHRLRPDRATGYPTATDPALDGIALLELANDVAARRPRARAELDHVPATPATLVARAWFLANRFTLAGRRVLFVGDHDLTSRVLAAAAPEVATTVVDVDDDVLAQAAGTPLWADLRVGLPPAARGCADVAFTDPPYTPEGVGLFVARAVEGLANPDTGRVVLAYGFGDQPGLALKVQAELNRLHLVYETVLPEFNRYDGAQAIGGASSLYVLRPAAATKRALKPAAGATNLYTRGRQSLESTAAPFELDGVPEGAWVDWRAVLGPTKPQPSATAAVALDLRADPGPLLLRVLLAVNAPRVIAVVRRDHPGPGSIIGEKYRVTTRRGWPKPTLAVVTADQVDVATLSADARARRRILDRPFDRSRPIDLPRHRLSALLDEVSASAGPSTQTT